MARNDEITYGFLVVICVAVGACHHLFSLHWPVFLLGAVFGSIFGFLLCLYVAARVIVWRLEAVRDLFKNDTARTTIVSLATKLLMDYVTGSSSPKQPPTSPFSRLRMCNADGCFKPTTRIFCNDHDSPTKPTSTTTTTPEKPEEEKTPEKPAEEKTPEKPAKEEGSSVRVCETGGCGRPIGYGRFCVIHGASIPVASEFKPATAQQAPRLYCEEVGCWVPLSSPGSVGSFCVHHVPKADAAQPKDQHVAPAQYESCELACCRGAPASCGSSVRPPSKQVEEPKTCAQCSRRAISGLTVCEGHLCVVRFCMYPTAEGKHLCAKHMEAEQKSRTVYSYDKSSFELLTEPSRDK